MSEAALAARDFRVSLEHRRDIDDLVAEAVAARQRATVDAAEIVRDAEALAKAIVDEARAEVARITAEAERVREVRGEKVSATIHRLESMASEVQMALDSALSEVAESLSDQPTASEEPEPAPQSPDPSSHQVRDAAEARLERWRERFRQTR